MLDYFNDKTIKIDHTPVIKKFAYQTNAIGAHSYLDIEEADFTYTDDNSIFVSDTVGADVNVGTQASPKKTIAAGITATTITKIYVVILDSVLYSEDVSGCTYTYFSGIYAATGETPTHSHRTLDYVPADANTIYVAKTGADGNAGTAALPKLTLTSATGAIATCDAAHQNVVILDSETYTEDSFEFTGNFQGLHAALGQKPTLKFNLTETACEYTETQEIISPTIIAATNARYTSSGLLQNGNIVCCYSDFTDGGKGKFVIIDSIGTSIVGSTTFEAGNTTSISVAVLQNGNFVICFHDGGDAPGKGKFVIYDEDGVEVVSAVTFEAGSTLYCSVAVLNNGNFVCSYGDTSVLDGKFVIYTEAGVNVAGPTQFEPGSTGQGSVAVLLDDNFVICYTDLGAADTKFVIYSEAGVNVAGPTQFEAGQGSWMSVATLDNGNWVCCYRDNGDAPGKGKFVIHTAVGVQVVVPTIFEAGNTISTSVAILNNGNWACCYNDVTTGDGKFVIYTEAGVNVVVPTQFEAGDPLYNSIGVFSNGNFFNCYGDDGDGIQGKLVTWFPYSGYGMKVSVASDLNGIILDADNDGGMDKIVSINGFKLTAKWNDLKNCDNPAVSTVFGYGIYGDNECDFYNNRFFDNDMGIYLSDDYALIHDNQFFRNEGGYAIHIKGASAISGDITIEHNDISLNNAGIRLENNSGGDDEILKNNIIHDNDNFGINADANVNYSYTDITDSTNGATAGTSVVLFNPLYINEGAADPDDIDLNIKTRVVGYFADSPAKNLADDSRNAGSFDVQYIGSETTWITITIAKPISMIPYLDPAGEATHAKRDGSISSDKTGQTEIIEFKWQALNRVDADLLRILWTSDETECRIYPDPDEHPNAYNIYFLIRKKGFPLGSRYWMQSDLGVEGLSLQFARAFEEA